MLTNATRATLVQVLEALKQPTVKLLFIKHLDVEPYGFATETLLTELAVANAPAVAGLLVELLADQTAVRADAPVKTVYDKRLEDLRRRLRADGYELVEDGLVRLLPGAEPASYVADSLESLLGEFSLDADGSVRRLFRESQDALAGVPPDYNTASTKARISLETLARRSSAAIAQSRNLDAPSDSWGGALSFLRSHAVIEKVEEEALAKVYTLISPGAHVPKGLSDEQWALLARTFALSGAYFLARKYDATRQ
jgi:hypothetical protein